MAHALLELAHHSHLWLLYQPHMAIYRWHYPNMAKPKIAVDPNLGVNLHLLMDRQHDLKSQMQVAKRTGLSQSSVGRILRGDVNPSASALNSIATAFGVEIGDLYLPPDEFAAKHMSRHQHMRKGQQDALNELAQFTDRLARGLVPMLTWKQVIAGSKVEPTEWVICPVPHSNNAYALIVHGLGMFDPSGPLSFREGDRIFVDTKDKPTHKSLVVVRPANGEEAVLRQLIAEGDQWMLLQLNPSWPNRVAPLATEDAILGTVIAKVQTFVADNVVVTHHSTIPLS
ncbi:MAG: S24 family peptidase [Acidovorax sp.]